MEKADENNYFNFNKNIGEKLTKGYLEMIAEPLVEIITIYSSKEKADFQKTINSVINQTFPYWKWQIVNITNAKDLDSIEILHKDGRINIIDKKDEIENIRNEIVKNTQCEFVFILDEGSILDDTVLECSYWSLKTNPDASWSYSNYVLDREILKDELFMSEDEKNKDIVSASYCIRRKEILEIGGYERKDKQTNLDWLLFLKLLQQNKFPVKMDFYGTWNQKIEKIVTEEIIEESKKIKNSLVGINYPVGSDYYFNTQPFELEWCHENKKDSDKINLLFVFPWFRVGGADKFNYDLISNLDKTKFEITILTTEPCPYIWRQKFENYAEIFDLTSFLHRRYWAPFMHYIIKTRNIKFVMNSNSYYGFYAIPWLKSKFPDVIFTDYLHAVNWNWRNGEYPADSTAISRILDKSFVTSNQVKEVMNKQMGRKIDNIEVAYIGVDADKFSKNNPEIKINEELLQYKEKYENKEILLFCSRISAEKRPILMVKILEALIQKREDIVLFVVGDGPELPEMKKKIEELGLQEYVIFFGMQEDVRPFYKLANLLVICSIREGITLTTYEALSMSVPVVTADVGGQKELVDNRCGRIVQNLQEVRQGEIDKNYSQEEIKRYVNAIEEVINSEDYEKMTRECRKKVEENLTIQKMVEIMQNEIETLVKEGSKIPKDLVNNEELYKNYLVMHNEIDRRTYNSARGGIIPEPTETIESKLMKQIETMRQELDNKNIEIQNKNNDIMQKDLEIQEKIDELGRIYNSKRWRYMDKILKIFKK